MKIFVPKYLRKLGVLGNLCNAVNEYSVNYNDSVDYSDDLFLLKIDPVKRFINLCLSEIKSKLGSFSYHKEGESDITTEYQDPNEVLNNLTHLFYSVSGTYNVLEYMGKYLGLEFEGTPTYTSNSLSFTLKKIIGDDLAIFEEYLNDFLNALLYYGKLEYDIKDYPLDIIIESKAEGRLSVNTFKRFKLDAEL